MTDAICHTDGKPGNHCNYLGHSCWTALHYCRDSECICRDEPNGIRIWTPTDVLPQIQKDIAYAIGRIKRFDTLDRPDTLTAMVRIQEALQAAIDKEEGKL